MSLAVVGILTLSVLPMSVLGFPCYLFMVDVTVPQMEGRNELDDITSIKTILDGFTDVDHIRAHFAMKALDNQLIRLIIDVDHVEGMCNWPSLTSALTKKGYKMSVTPMEDCSYYAARLGVNITYAPVSDFKQSPLLLTAVRQFDDKAIRGEAYLNEVKKHFELDVKTVAVEVRRCYAALMDLPVRLMYIGVGTIERALEINGETNLEGTTKVDFQMFLSMDVYKETC